MRPVRLIHHRRLFATLARHSGGEPRGLGGRRSEVKEETAAARPASEDMSGGGHPSSVAALRPDCESRGNTLANGSIGPKAILRFASAFRASRLARSELQVPRWRAAIA